MKKRRLLSIVLSLCMVLALMPQMVFAEGDDTSELQNLLNNDGTVTLSKDYTIDTTMNVTNTVTLDLNGYTISMTGSGSVINVKSGGNLTVKDSRPTATHTDASLPAGGVITREIHLTGRGGGVAVGGGSFTMNGGTIYNCLAEDGGGVAVEGGSFTMNGGTIYGCNAKPISGGGVAVYDGSFTMNGGSIYGCSAEMFGDAVFSNIRSNIYANGGTIKDTVVSCGKILNTATDGGCTRFYDEVTNDTTDTDHGTISSGIYYGGISGGGTVEGTYHTVSFDLNGGSGSIPKQWFVNIDTAQALEPAAPTRESYEFAGWYNGDTKYDFTQNVTENITLTAHWESVEVPVITVLENGKTYCDAVEFEVTDNVGVASVKAGDLELSPTNGKYTLEKGIGKVEVVAKDNAGNKTSVIVTVNNGHTGGTATCTQKAKCGICGEEYGELANHSLSKTDAKDATCTEDGNVEYWTCSVCHKLFSDENGTTETTQDAVTIRANGHTLNKIDAKEATAAETGNIEYWQCDNCKKYFADEKGENEITLDKTVISKLKPEIIDGKGQSITAGEKRALSFTSNAAFDDFKRVDLDGSELSEEYYEKAEGSIIITLDADYVATLPVGEHTIGIVSEIGTATTTFTVAEKAASGTSDDSDKDSKSDKDSVKTGDNTNLALWLALMLLAGAGITGTTLYTRRKRTNE